MRLETGRICPRFPTWLVTIAQARQPPRRSLCAGFTYLWVLLLVAFMGLGLSAAVEVHATSVQRDKEKELLAIGRQFRTAIGRYYEIQLQNGRREYPVSLEALLQDNRSAGVRRHLRKIFVDPMTGKAEWGLVRMNGRIVGVHSLADRKPIKQEGFDVDDMAFRGKSKYSEWVFTYPSGARVRSAEESEDDVGPALDTPSPAEELLPGNPLPGATDTRRVES